MMSRADGPGRYGRSDEETRMNCPANYVRWEENRNISGESGGPGQTRRVIADHPRVTAASGSGPYEMILSGRERFADGSVRAILYTTRGSPAFSKEALAVFADESVAVIDDFCQLELVNKRSRRTRNKCLGHDEGHALEREAFLEGVRKAVVRVDPEKHSQITLCTLQTVESLRSGQSERVPMGLLDEQPLAILEGEK